jgi:hypothetical protein
MKRKANHLTTSKGATTSTENINISNNNNYYYYYYYKND